MDEFMEVQGKTTEYFLLFFRSDLIYKQKFYHFMKYQTYHKQAVRVITEHWGHYVDYWQL